MAYLRHLGHPYQAQRDTGIDFAVLEAYLQYRAPLRFDDEVDVHLLLAGATRASFQMAYLTTDGQPRATAVTAHGAARSRRPATRSGGQVMLRLDVDLPRTGGRRWLPSAP